MDELTRRAILRAVTAFLVVFVVGSVAVAVVDRIGGASTPTASPSASVSVTPGVSTPLAWLAWIPGGLPEGFGESITTVDVVVSSTTAAADIAWMTGSVDALGQTVDSPPSPYMIPIDTTAIGPAFAGYLPSPEKKQVADLQPGQGLLSETEAEIRGLGKGGVLTFDTGQTVTIVGTLPDMFMGGYELLVNRATGVDIGVTHERYVLFHVRPNATPDPDQLAAEFLPYVPADAPYPDVEVRAPGQTLFLRANDGELPVETLKRLFGEFAALPSANGDGTLQIDPSWVQRHIASETVPVLGTVTCHAKAIVALKKAMTTLTKSGQATAITSVGDCFEAIASPDDPNGPLTSRAFGAAIDLNPQANQPGDTPSQPAPLVKAMLKAGFGWAGKDAYPQGSLFRYHRLPK